jgi:hypothetical protein
LKQALRLGFLPALLAVVIGFTAVAYPADAQSFAPTLEVAVVDTTPETPSDITVDFGIPKDDYQFAGVVQFIPPEWGIVKGDKLEIGADVGHLESKAVLGLINGACLSELPVVFDFKNASLDTSDTVSFQDEDDNGTADFAEDKDENDLFDAVDKYPDFLNSLFEDAESPPLRRTAGETIVAGIPVLLQFLIFAPGTTINENIPKDESLGFPTVTVLQNIGDPDAQPTPGAITDFCAPLTTTNTTFGGTADAPFFITPQNGTYTFTTIALGQRDADGDGYENSLDTCPFDVNDGNPKEANSGDLDGDGLDSACDPNDDPATGGTDSDEDADGYLNRQDNCPQDANGENDESNQVDEDLDQIGDACDPEPAVANGDLSSVTLEAEVVIGDGTGPGGPPSDEACGGPDMCAPSTGGSVDDGDGGGSNTGVIIGIVVAVIAAIVIIGGGAALMMRRREGGS